MESNRTLNDAAMGLNNISDIDLEAILKFESPPITDEKSQCYSSYKSLQFNREEMDSQLNFNFENSVNCSFLNALHIDNFQFSLKPLNNIDDVSSSLVVSSPDVENVNLTSFSNEKTQEREELIVKEEIDLSANIGTEQLKVASSFCDEFLRDNDFDFSTLDLDAIEFKVPNDEFNNNVQNQKNHLADLSLISASQVNSSLIQQVCNEQYENNDVELTNSEVSHTPLNLSSEREMSFKRPALQIPHHKSQEVNKTMLTSEADERFIVSCPVKKLKSIAETNFASSKLNPINFLALDYSDASQTSTIEHFSSFPPSRHYLPLRGVQNEDMDENYSNSQNPINYSKDVYGSARSDVTAALNFNIVNSYSAADSTYIPSSVKQLYDAIKTSYSDFAFVYALSAQMCQDRVPMDCFISLKMGLLLSIASLESNPNRPPIPVVAIGTDVAMANCLMTNIADLAERFIGPSEEYKTTSTKSKYTWIEADPILLAKGGVYYVGDWCRLKTARAEQIFKNIESCKVALEKTSIMYPLQTAIWTHWRSYKYNAKDQQTFNKFIKIFGIPIVVDDDNHEVLVDYILEQSSVRIFESSIDHLTITPEEMRGFLAVISKRTVDITPNASVILQKYFVASRIDRPDCLPKQALCALTQFAESFAKLALRHEVLPIDAIAAIYMSEHFIHGVFGAGECPPPSFKNHNFVGNVDEHMTKFQEWLRVYIERYYKT